MAYSPDRLRLMGYEPIEPSRAKYHLARQRHDVSELINSAFPETLRDILESDIDCVRTFDPVEVKINSNTPTEVVNAINGMTKQGPVANLPDGVDPMASIIPRSALGSPADAARYILNHPEVVLPTPNNDSK